MRLADLVTKKAPIFTGFKTTAAVGLFDLTAQDIAAVGAVPERGFSDHCFQRAVAMVVRAHHWKSGNMPSIEGLTRADVKTIIALEPDLKVVEQYQEIMIHYF